MFSCRTVSIIVIYLDKLQNKQCHYSRLRFVTFLNESFFINALCLFYPRDVIMTFYLLALIKLPRHRLCCKTNKFYLKKHLYSTQKYFTLLFKVHAN